MLNSEPAAHVALVMAWHAEAPDADLNWPAGHKVQVPSSAVDPVSPLVAESLLNSELLGYGRDPLAPIKDAVTADGDVVVPLDAEAFGFWLKAAFGQSVTTGTGPWTHEFRVFRADLERYEAAVLRTVKVSLAPHEFDALVSFHYNTGGIAKAAKPAGLPVRHASCSSIPA